MSKSPPALITQNGYPTSDGRPMAETDLHRDLMQTLIKTLQHWYASQSNVYVSGNLLVYYVPGNKRRHLAPDVFVVKGIPNHQRINYLIWEEGRGPNIVIELTSSSTRHEDRTRKFRLYQDVLRVPEYFLFDPFGDYPDPPLQGYRRRQGAYVPIRLRHGRLPSKQLGLHLERADQELRFYDPQTQVWLPTPEERVEQAEGRIEQAEVEAERLRRENEELRRRLGERP